MSADFQLSSPVAVGLTRLRHILKQQKLSWPEEIKLNFDALHHVNKFSVWSHKSCEKLAVFYFLLATLMARII
jgi:hypothetical protein